MERLFPHFGFNLTSQSAYPSGSSSQILPQDAGMSSRDSQQSKRRALRAPSTLFPVTKGMNADAHRAREPRLRQPYETPQCGHILSRLESPLHQSLANPGGYGASQRSALGCPSCQSPHVGTKEGLFRSRRPTRGDDANHIFVPFGPDDQDKPTPDWADGNEAILVIRMGIIEKL